MRGRRYRAAAGERRCERPWGLSRALPWVLLAAGATAVAAQPGLDVVRRSIAHHGGELYDSSAVTMTMCSGSGCYELAVESRGGVYRHRVAGPVSAGHRAVEATNDTVRHWRDGVEVEIADATEAQRLRDWATARLYFAFLPYRLDDPSAMQRDLGLERWGERELRKVKVTFRPGTSSDAQDEFLYWFDAETGRLEQFAYSFAGRPGGLRFRRLDNYQRVGGLLFFDQENLGVEGDGLSVDQIDPAFVTQRMRPISRIHLDHITVTPLP